MKKPKAKDDADIASEQEEKILAEALWRSTKAKRMQHRGNCYNCGESTQDLFCDVECRRDYEKEQKIKGKQRGEAAGDQHGK